MTAQDFAWSWERALNPIYLGRYAEQLYAVKNARAYNEGRIQRLAVAVGDHPAGTPVYLEQSRALHVVQDAEPTRDAGGGAAVGSLVADTVVAEAGRSGDDVQVRWRPGCPDLGHQTALLDCTSDPVTGWIAADDAEPAFPLVNDRVVATPTNLVDGDGAAIDTLERGDAVYVVARDGSRRRVYFSERERFGWLDASALADPGAREITYVAHAVPEVDFDASAKIPAPPDDTSPDSASTDGAAPAQPASFEVRADQLQTDPDVLGFRAVDPHTLVVRLQGTAPYFLQQTSHTTLRAAPRQAVERWGPQWTRPEHIVTDGPYRLAVHRVRDRIVLEKNPDYWMADQIALDTVIAYPIESQVTSVDMYRAGYTDVVVADNIPPEFIPMLEDKKDFWKSPALSVYIYRLNTTKPPLDDVRVRRALAMAIDKRQIVQILEAGQLVADHIVPPGLPGYEAPPGPGYDPAAARALLAEAGYPGGKGFPELKVLYNTLEMHKNIAAIIQSQWKQNLGIDVTLENREWKTFLKAVDSLDYDVARGGWIGDYVDPNTFLEMWTTGAGNNETGWSSPAFDQLIAQARQEPDPGTRMADLAAAEQILDDQMPFIPLYWYVWVGLKQPGVQGYHPNVLDEHPLRWVSIER